MQLLSTKTHGILDYLTVGFLLIFPRLMRWNRRVTLLLTGAALGSLTYSLLTRYEMGVIGALPMETHLNLDAMSGLSLASAPVLMRSRERDVNAALVGIGLYELAAALSTDPISPVEKQK